MLLFTAVMAIVLSGCSQNSVKSAKITSAEDSLSYAFGVNFYHSTAQDSIKVNPLLMAKGMAEAKENEAIMDDMMARGFIMSYFQKREQEQMAGMYKESMEAGVKFLEKNKEKSGVITTESGLQYEVLTLGTGSKPTVEKTVKVHYTGTLMDGTPFDSSIGGEPAQFQVGGVIPGWVEALQLMPVGSKFKLYIPSELGYGQNGAGDVIPPFSVLIFEVELLEIIG
jgi:FKBP-type peptidyl-prolyl cis-trans isomerase